MASGFLSIVQKIIRKGNLKLTLANGETHTVGDGSGDLVAVRIADEEAEKLIRRDPTLKLGEMYMDGRFILEHGNIYDFLAMVKQNTTNEIFDIPMAALLIGRIALQQLKSRLPINHNKRNVAHHYDLSERLFELFLDEDWQYSCAYFDPPGISLEEAQVAKKRHIAAKMLLQPNQRVLEIGSGWGGMGLYIAEATPGLDHTGITLSEEQLKISRDRAEKRGLADRVRFELQDYRTMRAQPFDRIVSVGMFEHVGIGNFANYFRKVHELLADDGVMVLHSIARPKPSFATNAFIEKYIFPQGISPRSAKPFRPSRRPGCWSAMSKSCRCTTPTRCATGATVSSPARQRRWRSMTNASSACGSSISPAPRSVSAGTSCSSCRSRSPRTSIRRRITAITFRRRKPS